MEGAQVSRIRCGRCRELQSRLREQQGVIGGLQSEIGRLQSENEHLRAQFEQSQRDGKRQTVRFPRRTRKTHPRRPGRHEGHQAEHRPVPQSVDHTIQVPVDSCCPDCGGPLDITTHTQYQTDIPKVEPTVTQFRVEVGVCSSCGTRVQARHPRQVSDALGAANHVLGPNAHALAAALKNTAGMSFAKISRFLREAFGLSSAAATFVRAGLRIAHKAQGTIAQLWADLRKSSCLHSDETGWRIGVNSVWMWVFADEQTTLFDIGRRSHHLPAERLAGFDGVLCCDGLAVYDLLDLVTLRCNAHVLARLARLKETFTQNGRTLRALTNIEAVFRQAHDLHGRREQMTAKGFARSVSHIEHRFQNWLRKHKHHSQLDVLRLRNHLAAHANQWFLYLYNPQLPTTNNLAERQIRPGVITRRMGGCNKTVRGALVTKTLASLSATCRQRRKSFLDAVSQLMHARAPTTLNLATLPATN